MCDVSPDAHVSDSTLQALAAACRRLEPATFVDTLRIPVPETDREVIVLTAAPRPEHRPYVYDGRPYERLGTTTALMPQARYLELLLLRPGVKHWRWENQPAIGIGIDDLDTAAILTTARDGRLPDAEPDDPRGVLDKLHLMLGGQLVNAAVVLFGRTFLPNYAQCELRLARFVGRTKGEFFDNPPPVRAHAFALLREAEQFLRKHLPRSARVVSTRLERVEELLLPPAALREALVNAICHRDYSQPGGAVSVAVYDDRVEIANPGALPPGWTPETLLTDHESLPGNELIANALHVRGLVERWGRGTQDMAEWCRRAGHPAPTFLVRAGHVVVQFTPRVPLTPPSVGHEGLELPVVGDGLTTRQRQILSVLGTGEQSLQAIANVVGVGARRAVRRDPQVLRERGLVEVRGFGRGAVWARRRPGSERNKPE